MEYYVFNVIKNFAERHTIQNEVGKGIDKLIEENFSEAEVASFKILIEEYLSTSQSGFALSAMFDKAKEIFKIINYNDNTEKSINFRKFVKTLIAFNNEKVLAYLETHLITKDNLSLFFIFLEELAAANRDTTFVADSFIRLIYLNKINITNVNTFLKILSKDKIWLINKLLSLGLFSEVIRQIHETAAHEKDKLKDIAIAIASFADKETNLHRIPEIIVHMIQYSIEFMDILMHQKSITLPMLKAAIISEQRSSAINNYAYYAYSEDMKLFKSFEKDLVSLTSKPNILIDYVVGVPFSSKRLILKKLINLQAEKELVYFIKKFPEYRHLLPML